MAKAKLKEAEIKEQFRGCIYSGAMFEWNVDGRKEGTADWILNEGRSQPETRQQTNAMFKNHFAWRNPWQD